MIPSRGLVPVVLLLLLGALLWPVQAGAGGSGTGLVPLMDLGTGTYLGAFAGGLYENGGNAPSADHHAAGLSAATEIEPLDAAGVPSETGKIVLLSVGMSNTTQEFCLGNEGLNCAPFSFMGKAAADPAVDVQHLVIVDGAKGGQTAATWDSPSDANWDRVRDERLAPRGVTEQQVQAAWVKLANPGPTISLPNANADAYALQISLGNVARAMAIRYPNLKLIFFSSRIYAGYATTTLNPEPYAYESGFSVKWLIQGQVDQMRNAGTVVDPRSGDLNYESGIAPWVGWAAYLWADGLTVRSDGLFYAQSDLQADGTHPAQGGINKVADELLAFFLSSPYSEGWFTAPASVGGAIELPATDALEQAAHSDDGGAHHVAIIVACALAGIVAAGVVSALVRRQRT